MTELTCFRAYDLSIFSGFWVCIACKRNNGILFKHKPELSDCGCIRRSTTMSGKTLTYGDPVKCQTCMEENFDLIWLDELRCSENSVVPQADCLWATKIKPPTYGKKAFQ